jgi:GAF domain-containing protein
VGAAGSGCAGRAVARTDGYHDGSGAYRFPEGWGMAMAELHDTGLVALHAALGDGVRAALVELGRRSPYRFTAMYRFDDPALRNLYFVDRDDPAAEAGDDHPVEATYCVYLRDGGEPFLVEDAPGDARLDGHAACERVRAYCGVPLLGEGGRVVGTLCHFDFVPVATDPAALTRATALAALLAG